MNVLRADSVTDPGGHNCFGSAAPKGFQVAPVSIPEGRGGPFVPMSVALSQLKSPICGLKDTLPLKAD